VFPPVKTYTPKQIKSNSQKTAASQTVFAAYLNTSPSIVTENWEVGGKKT